MRKAADAIVLIAFCCFLRVLGVFAVVSAILLRLKINVYKPWTIQHKRLQNPANSTCGFTLSPEIPQNPGFRRNVGLKALNAAPDSYIAAIQDAIAQITLAIADFLE